MKTKSLFTAALILAIAVLLAACAPPLDNRGQGNIRISLSGGTPAGARAVMDSSGDSIGGVPGDLPSGPPADLSYYQLDFSGPGGETHTETLKLPDETLNLTLALGDWTVLAQAFNTDHVLCGRGQAGFPVEAGRTQDVTITMTAVPGTPGTPDIPFSLPLTSVAEVKAYLASVSGGDSAVTPPVSLPVSFNLAGNWTGLLDAINIAGKYVALDLSACNITGMSATAGEFDPGAANTGESKIVSLVLPGGATSIKAMDGFSPPAFQYFNSLIGVRGENVITIGDGAFLNCASLIMVDLPSTTEIGYSAFEGCTSLRTVDFPAATDVRDAAFFGCSFLTTALLPQVRSVSARTFFDCASLMMADLSEALDVLNMAFYGCSSLTTVNLPKAETIESYVFQDCTSLVSVELPKAETIETYVFQGCTSLESVDLSAVTTIGFPGYASYAFADTGTKSLTIILGNTVPTVGTETFRGAVAAGDEKHVTILIPSGTETSYNSTPYSDTDTTSGNWGNAFRGRGWNGGTLYLAGVVNSDIRLTFGPY